MRYPVDWVDAFTDTPFGGNGCAVVHDGGALATQACLAFTRETSLVECTFVAPSEVADVRVRYFLQTHEIPFAGHPTIATVASLLHRGLVPEDSCRLETGAGIVEVEMRDGWIEMTQIAPTFGAEVPAEEVAEVVDIDPADVVAPPQIVSTGLPFCVTVLGSLESLQAARLTSPEALARFEAKERAGGMQAAWPYLVYRGGATAAGDTFSRLLLATASPPEDPFTGSATGAAASYLWSRGLIASPAYIAEQGHGLGRPGQARVQVLGPPEAITGVKVAGKAHVLMSGDLLLSSP